MINRLIERPQHSQNVSAIQDIIDAAVSDADDLIDLWRKLDGGTTLSELANKIKDVVGAETFDVALASIRSYADLEPVDTGELEDAIELLVSGEFLHKVLHH